MPESRIRLTEYLTLKEPDRSDLLLALAGITGVFPTEPLDPRGASAHLASPLGDDIEFTPDQARAVVRAIEYTGLSVQQRPLEKLRASLSTWLDQIADASN